MTFQHTEIRHLLDEVTWPDSTFRKVDPGMPFEDWEVLFKAVKGRLRDCVSVPAYTSPEHSTENPLVATQNIVRECVQALDVLHSALQRNRLDYF